MFSNSNIFLNILFKIMISISIILLGHWFWNYLKDTYTTKKTKDLVNIHIEKYKKIVDEIQQYKPFSNNTGSQKTVFETENERQKMNDELVEFMNKQMES